MTTMNVQFSDSTDQTIIAAFAVAQDPAYYTNLGTVDTSDPRWKTYYDSLPEFAQAGWPAPD
jgi:hypothetical protein